MRDLNYSDLEAAQQYQLTLLNKILQEAKKAPFYNSLYKDIKLPLKSLEELKLFPVLDKLSLCSEGQTCNNNLFTRSSGGCYTFSTGGTSGRMTFARYGLDEFREVCSATAYGLESCGIGPGDIVANCIRAGAFWTAFLTTYRALEKTGCDILPITDNQPVEKTLEYLEMMRPNTLFGISPTLVQIAQEAHRRGTDLDIRKVGFASTPLTTEQKDFLSAIWPKATFHSAGYGAAEVGPIGFQCQYCKGTEHHILQPNCIVERDEDGGVIATSLIRTLQPAIRMKVDDDIEWISDPCPCGRSAPRFKILHRSDEVLQFDYDELPLEALGACLGKFKQLTPVFQVRLDPNGKQTDILIRIEAGDNEAVDDYELSSKVFRCMVGDIPAIGENKEKNMIRAVKVLIVPSGGIPKVEITGKIRRVIDKRL